MHLSPGGTSEVAILSRVLEARKPTLSPQAARDLLALEFGPADKERMRQLSAKARAGTLTAEEQIEIENYERLGHVLNILLSKARRSLKRKHAAKSGASRRSADPR